MALNFILDLSGFPMVKLEKKGFYIHLLPVTRYQFERFICSSGKKGYGDSWYETIESLNHRVSPAKIDSSNYEGAFISGVTPAEAMDFIGMMGANYDLPTVEEWREAYLFLKNVTGSGNDFSVSLSEGVAAKVMKSIARLPGNFFDKTFMNNCLVEWVRKGNGFAGLGSPRSTFHENAYNPEVDIWRPFNVNNRMHFFGMRGVMRIERMIREC